MSAEQRKQATLLADRYARCFKVDRATVVVEMREDEDCEVWAPGVCEVWTRGCDPYQTTLDAAGVTAARAGERQSKASDE